MFRSLILAASLCLSCGIQAAETYHFDTKHTQILFFVDHLGFSKSQGEFHDYSGNFKFDRENWGNSSVEVHVRTHSVDMDDYKWDKHLRSEDFLNSAEMPVMSFRSQRVEKTGEDTGRIHGELTLLRQTHPLVLDFKFNKAGVHPKSKQFVAGFSATGTVVRSQYGMNYGVPFVGDEVELRIEVEGIRTDR